MTEPLPSRSVASAKITEYLLNPAHEAGGPKETYFRAFGFSAARWETMAAALTAHPDRNPVEETLSDRWGTRYVVRCCLSTPDGRDPCIVTVWIVPIGQTDARLVTAYPA